MVYGKKPHGHIVVGQYEYYTDDVKKKVDNPLIWVHV